MTNSVGHICMQYAGRSEWFPEEKECPPWFCKMSAGTQFKCTLKLSSSNKKKLTLKSQNFDFIRFSTLCRIAFPQFQYTCSEIAAIGGNMAFLKVIKWWIGEVIKWWSGEVMKWWGGRPPNVWQSDYLTRFSYILVGILHKVDDPGLNGPFSTQHSRKKGQRNCVSFIRNIAVKYWKMYQKLCLTIINW